MIGVKHRNRVDSGGFDWLTGRTAGPRRLWPFRLASHINEDVHFKSRQELC